jgi:hypothetical protein
MESSRYAFAVLLLMVVFAALSPVFSQTQYGYEYDDSGNRISRQVIPLRSAEVKDDQKKEEIYKGALDSLEIKIFPNPTKGTMTVEVPLKDRQDQVQLRIYNMKGVLISFQDVAEEKTTIFLNDQPSGIYIMRISCGKSVSEWKIIKQ